MLARSQAATLRLRASSTMNTSSRGPPPGSAPSVFSQLDVKSAQRPSCETLARGVSQNDTSARTVMSKAPYGGADVPPVCTATISSSHGRHGAVSCGRPIEPGDERHERPGLRVVPGRVIAGVGFLRREHRRDQIVIRRWRRQGAKLPLRRIPGRRRAAVLIHHRAEPGGEVAARRACCSAGSAVKVLAIVSHTYSGARAGRSGAVVSRMT